MTNWDEILTYEIVDGLIDVIQTMDEYLDQTYELFRMMIGEWYETNGNTRS